MLLCIWIYKHAHSKSFFLYIIILLDKTSDNKQWIKTDLCALWMKAYVEHIQLKYISVNTCRDSCLCLRVIADEWRSDVLELIFVFITNKEIKAKQITSGSLHFNYRQYKRVIDP